MAGIATAFGLLKYRRTENLGDEIQSLAARRFLPRVDRTIDRDRLHRLGWKGTPFKLIMNGWFTHRPDNWPPHPAIDPLLLSFHLTDQMTTYGFSAAEVLVVGENAAWLRAHGPVGARDEWTLDLMHKNGIDAWLSGCLTLTLQRPPDVSRERYIVLNDVDDEIYQLTRKHTRAEIVRSTHLDRTTRSTGHRFAKAEQLLRLYAGAGYVVTSRLHCALPCLAMGTPLLLVRRATPSKRFSGLSQLVPTVVQSGYADRLGTLSLDEPPANPSHHLVMRDDLERRCRHFVLNAAS
jgi:hypothetical protein